MTPEQLTDHLEHASHTAAGFTMDKKSAGVLHALIGRLTAERDDAIKRQLHAEKMAENYRERMTEAESKLAMLEAMQADKWGVEGGRHG